MAVEPLSVHVVEVQPLSAHAAVVVVAELVVVVSDDLFQDVVVVVSDDLPLMTFPLAEEPVALAYYSCRKNLVLLLVQALRRDPPVVLEFSVPRLSLLLLVSVQALT